MSGGNIVRLVRPHDASRQSLKLIVLILVTLALAALLWSHFLLDGSRFHRWAWHRAPAWPFAALMAAAAVPFAIAQMNRVPRALSIGLLMVSLLFMQMVSSMAQDHEVSLMPIARQAQSKLTTSYLADAKALIDAGVSSKQLLASYPQRLDSFHLHARSKPPGPILYWYFWLSVLDSAPAAGIVGGLVIGVLSTFSVTATYWFINTATRDRDAALAGASYFALTPALIVFLPQFDQIYPALACALLVTWMLALRTGKLSWSIALGVILWLITFTTYTLLVLGVFLIGYWFLTRAEGRRALKISAISLAIIVAMYALLWITTGYNPLATFRTVLTLQSAMKTELNRPWLAIVPADFVDLLMGLCWLALLLLVFHFINRHNRSSIAWLGLVQILIVAFTGLLPGETARVWMFMVPLLMVPVGLELSRWLPQHRWMVYLCLWLLVMMTGQNLRFH